MYKEYRHMSRLYKEYRHMLHFSAENILFETQAGQISLWNSSSMRKCMRDCSMILIFGALCERALFELCFALWNICFDNVGKCQWKIVGVYLKLDFILLVFFRTFVYILSIFWIVSIFQTICYTEHLKYKNKNKNTNNCYFWPAGGKRAQSTPLLW